MYCVDEVTSMFERNSFSELDMSSFSSSGDEVLDISEPEAIPVEKFEEQHISDDESMGNQDIHFLSLMKNLHNLMKRFMNPFRHARKAHQILIGIISLYGVLLFITSFCCTIILQWEKPKNF